AYRADGERVEHHLRNAITASEVDGGQHHGGNHGHHVSLEQVGGHAGAVANIVADIVRNGRWVARIVLGDAGLDFAYEIAPDIGALGEDAATKPREDRDEGGAEAEGDQRIDHLPRGRAQADELGEDEEINRDAEKSEAGNEEASDRAGAEGEA